ncbi:helix-turn-helix domain-containing protein [Verminephrobacter eiseniae]|uniref:hypothetical protein n=1 Tax=Verminephrobacter eiseniae TaxID=364317 RepID=UPI002238C8D6|nr:hypothetical protein [Verminephrobacter eiseniae]
MLNAGQPPKDVASAVGVSVATLYRHCPARKWYGRLPPQGLTSKRKMNSAQSTTYPPGASHLGTTGVMCLRRARPVVPRPCPVDRSAPWLAWGGFSNEVESRGPTASRCQRWKIESSQANRRLRNEW